MHFFLLICQILAALALTTTGITADTVTTTRTTSVCPSACASDNCFRQLAGRTSSASAFCSSFTTQTNTAATAFPTYLSASCGVSRVSSVCSCLWLAPATTSPPQTSTAVGGTVTVVSTTTIVACPASLNLLSHGNNPCLSPWTSLDEIIENNVGNYTLRSVSPAVAVSSDGACEILFDNTLDQQSVAEYEFTHLVTFPVVPHAYTLSFWAAATDAESAQECYIIASFASQSIERSFYSLSTDWTQFVLAYTVEAGDDGGWVAIVVVCQSNGNNFEWAVRLDEVQLFASRP